MEENQKKKFICKFCNKKFPCGKSLGGHIRTHLSGNGKKSVRRKQEEEENRTQVTINKFSSSNCVSNSQTNIYSSEAGLNSSYELRMNPRKSWRITDPTSPLRGELKFCKERGKGFQSLKALCGHMASHSEKEKLINKSEEEQEEEGGEYYDDDDDDDSEGIGKQKLGMDSQSETETSSAPRQRRILKRTNKCNNLEVYDCLAKGSSSCSGIEHERQEVAISLMMLSRDYGYKGGLNSFAESSDNNSIIVEAKSSSVDMIGSTTKDVLNSATKIKDFVQTKKTRDEKLKSTEISVSENSDSGYFRYGPKKFESDFSVHGFQRNSEVKKLEVESGSGIKCYNAKFGKGSNKLDSAKVELGKNMLNEEAKAKNQVERRSSKYELRKRTKDGFCTPNVEVVRDSHKKSKTFHFHRSLRTLGVGGNNSKNNGFSGSMYESGENSIETDEKLIEVCRGETPNKHEFSGNAEKKSGSNKKSKGHECPICLRVFKSGQALGGHKRSHFIGGGCYEDKTVVIRQESSETEISRFFDLNLPAPVEEEPNRHVGFRA